MKILLTGATGMLGGYLFPLLRDGNEVKTLQRHDADIICDLTADTPDFGENIFELVVHAAGSTEAETALDLNLEGTRHLLHGLEGNPPKELVYISSWEVYSPDSGENVAEDHQTWAATKVGQSKARAEELVRDWCAQRGVTLTILRPARMFGKGVHGEMKRLFNDVVNGRYVHVRGNEGRLSLVAADTFRHSTLEMSSWAYGYHLAMQKSQCSCLGDFVIASEINPADMGTGAKVGFEDVLPIVCNRLGLCCCLSYKLGRVVSNQGSPDFLFHEFRSGSMKV